MAILPVAPTKSNLLKTKTSLAFAREGHELLTRKRDILIAELLGLMASAARAERALEEKLGEAFRSLEESILDLGERAVKEASWAVNLKVITHTSERRVMGVNLPSVHSSVSGSPPYYALRPTSFWLDEAQRRFQEVIKCLDEVSGLRISVIRLAREVTKTVRRVNALEKMYIPDYADTLQYIQDALEESDRESFFVLKLIKDRLSKLETAHGK